MEPPNDEKALKRAIFVGRIVLVWGLIIGCRLVWLQVIKHDEYAAAARAQQRHRFPIPSLRGEVLDREGYPLAISIRTQSAVVNPQRVVDPIFFSRLIAPVLGLEPKDSPAGCSNTKTVERGEPPGEALRPQAPPRGG